jgi:serine/threonine protein kinase
MLIRSSLVTLQDEDLHVLLDKTRHEISAIDYLNMLGKHSAIYHLNVWRNTNSTINTSWSPSLVSHLDILPHLRLTLCRFFTCLMKSLNFPHSCPIKHMDIKPQNIPVRNIKDTSINDTDPFKIYITDFGLSPFYVSVGDTETDSWTTFARAYAAQEVVLQVTRGLSADIFSMGCAYAEMLSVVLDGLTDQNSAPEGPTHWGQLKQARSGTDGETRAYRSKLKDVVGWLRGISIAQTELNAVR